MWTFYWRSDDHMTFSHVTVIGNREPFKTLIKNTRDQLLLCAMQKETGDILRVDRKTVAREMVVFPNI